MGCCLGKTENTSSKELVEKREHPDEREKKTDNSEYKLGKNDVRQSPPQEEDDVKNIIHVHSVHRKADSDDESEGSEHGDSKNEVEVENETVSTEVEVIDSENGVEDGVKGVDSKDRDSIEDIKPEQAQGAEDAPPIPPSAHVEQSTAPSTSLPPTSQPSEEPTHAQRRAVEEGLERRDSLPAPPEGYATGAGAGGGGEEGAGEVLRGESFTRQRSGSADSDSSVVSASSVFQAMARRISISGYENDFANASRSRQEHAVVNGKEVVLRRTFGKYENGFQGVGWVEDADVSHCMICNSEFDRIFLSKHHCRACGNIICHKCSPKKALVHGIEEYGQQRVCVQCHWGQELVYTTSLHTIQEE